MRIDSSGRVGIGTTDFAATSSYADNLVVKDSTDAGITIQGANSTSEYSSIYLADTSVNRGWLEQSLGGGTSSLLTIGTAGITRFYNNSGERMRILPTGGITFNGDTATANALDDYEEGTWTPALYVSSGTHPTLTITSNYSSYTKVGSLVTFSADFVATISSVGSGSGLRISLPFAPSVSAGRHVFSGGPQGRASTGLTLPNYELSWYYYTDGARLYQQFANGVETSLSPSFINSGSYKRFNIGGFYYVD